MKTLNKEVVFLTEIELISGNNNILKSIFCIDAKDKENLSISDLWIDCDHVKYEGEQGRGNFPFVKHENKSKIYIISMWETDDETEEIINWWLQGCENECEIDNNWDDWDKVKTGVAYRGGSGYSYALYVKELL